MIRYRRFRHRIVCGAREWMFELGAAQIAVGLGLWVVAYVIKSGEPPIVLAMSALALVFSGVTTIAVAATDEDS